MDCDLLFVDNVCSDIIGDLVAVPVPWFYKQPVESWPYESSNKLSTAYVSPKEKKIGYYTGGFFGGIKEEFWKMVQMMMNNIDKDLKESPPIIALWHDERYFNLQFIFDIL